MEGMFLETLLQQQPLRLGVVLLVLLFLAYQLWLFKRSCLHLKHERDTQFRGIPTTSSSKNNHTRFIFDVKNYPCVAQKSCLVTGGCGFLGKHVVDALVRLGCTVRVLDLSLHATPVQGVEYMQGDLCNQKDLERACTSDIDIVFHCATPNPFSPNKKLLHDVNVRFRTMRTDATNALQM